MAGGKPIETQIDLDVTGVEKGAESVAEAFEEVQDSLKDTAKAGEKAGEQIEDSVKEAAKVIDRDLTKALDEAADKAKTSGRNIGDGVKDGTTKAKEGFGELADESKSTAKEAAASFSGIEDSADALQEVLANAFSGFGPAGVAAGIAAAIGVGLAISAMQDQADKTNEAKQAALDLAEALRDNGGAFSQAMAIQAMDEYGQQIVDTKEWWEVFQSEAISGFEELRNRANDAGVSLKEAFTGAFGPGQDAVRVQEQLARQIAEVERSSVRTSGALDETGQAISYVTDEGAKQLEGLRALKGQVDENVKKQQDAAEIERIRKEAIAGTTEALRENIDAVEAQTDAVKESLTSELDYLDGVDALNAKLKENGATLDVNTAKGRDNARAVIDQANTIEEMAQAQLNAGDSVADVTGKFNAQKNMLISQVLPAFNGNRAAAEKYISSILRIPQGAKTDVKANTAQAERDINHVARDRSATVSVYPNGQYVDHYIQTLQGRKVFVDIAPRGGVGITN